MNKVDFEQRFGIIDPGIEQANLLRRTLVLPRGCQRFGVWVGLRDTGEANATIPVLNELSKRYFDVSVMATERGEDELRSGLGFRLLQHRDPMLRMGRMRGNAVITGFSDVPSIEMALNAIAHSRGTIVFAVEDFPGAYFSDLANIYSRVPDAIPDYLFVMNEWAKRANLRSFPDFPEDRIIVSGAPALDRIAHSDQGQIRKEVREKLGVREDETLITWCGQISGATVESLQVLLRGLEVLKPENYKLATRFHPRDDNPREVYDAILNPFRDRHVDAGRAVVQDANRVIAASDLVVQERSTIALQAAAWGVPVISIAIPEIIAKYGVMMGLKVPVIEDGTSPLVEKEDNMVRVLEQVLFDASFRRDLEVKMGNWKSDGRAAERIANKMIELMIMTYMI